MALSRGAAFPIIAAVLVLLSIFVFIAVRNFLLGGILILIAIVLTLYWRRDIRDIVLSMLLLGVTMGVILAIFGGVMFVVFGLIAPRIVGS